MKTLNGKNFLETLINTFYLTYFMKTGRLENLEKKIPSLLSEAVSLISQKGRDIYLYKGNISYRQHSSGIKKLWKGKHPKGYAMTEYKDVTRDEFLQWAIYQTSEVQIEIYNNLLNYINTETPKERGQEESRSYVSEA